MKRKHAKSKRPAKSKRTTKAASKRYDPFVPGETIIMDNPKVDRTPRPTTTKNLKELFLKEFGELPPVRKTPVRKKKA